MQTICATFPVLHMHCAACARAVEDTIRSQAGVVDVRVNLAASDLALEYVPSVTSPALIRKALKARGYDLLTDKNQLTDAESIRRSEQQKLKRQTTAAAALTLPIVALGMFWMDAPSANLWMWALATPVVFGLGRRFFIRAAKQVKHKSAGMDVLVALSVGAAYLFSVFNTLFPHFWLEKGIVPHVYFETASVIVALILLGRWLEEKAKSSASSSIKRLIGLQPNTVTIVRDDGQTVETGVEQVSIGDRILVRPGEQIAVDGVVTDGQSYVDESLLSGEPTPTLKQASAKVFAGTMNGKGSFRFRAEKVGADTLLAQIIRRVREAQNSKAPVQKRVDRIAGLFVPAVALIALAALGAWTLLGGVNGFVQGLLAFVTVVIIACPCALGLATPAAITVGIGRGAELGILIKDAESLEAARAVNVVALDKTGTITEGKPRLTQMRWAKGNEGLASVLYSLEMQSEHPVAEAIVQHLSGEKAHPVAAFESLPGKGATGIVDGKRYWVGNTRLLTENGVAMDPQLVAAAEVLAAESQSVVWFANERQSLALMAVGDRIKDSSRAAIRQLQKQGIAVYLLTGDQASTAKAVAEALGVDGFQSEALPQQKAEFIKKMQAEGKTVAMAGDGINDSAALAQANVGIAMGQGSDIAIETAQMIVVSSDLSLIPAAIRLSKQTVKIIRQNLFWAFIYNLIGIPVAAGALYAVNGFVLDPMLAGGAMALSSLSVVGNSLRLRWSKVKAQDRSPVRPRGGSGKCV